MQGKCLWGWNERRLPSLRMLLVKKPLKGQSSLKWKMKQMLMPYFMFVSLFSLTALMKDYNNSGHMNVWAFLKISTSILYCVTPLFISLNLSTHVEAGGLFFLNFMNPHEATSVAHSHSWRADSKWWSPTTLLFLFLLPSPSSRATTFSFFIIANGTSPTTSFCLLSGGLCTASFSLLLCLYVFPASFVSGQHLQPIFLSFFSVLLILFFPEDSL